MKSYKLAKYNIKSSLKSIIIYYLIFTGAITGLELMSRFLGGNAYTSGLDFSSVIFLFVLGLNSFKENFNFTQANNISRQDYFKAVVIAILPIGLAMSILDVIINRVYNLFAVSPTLYDMSYHDYTNYSTNKEVFIQSNSIETLFGIVTFLFAFYIATFGLGLFITLIYYNSNKTMKILVSLSPIAIIAIFQKFAIEDPEFLQKVAIFIDTILGISTKNSYAAVITFISIFIISMFLIYLLVRRAVVKRI